MYGAFTYMYHKIPTIHIGKHTSPMDPMGYEIRKTPQQICLLREPQICILELSDPICTMPSKTMCLGGGFRICFLIFHPFW